MQFTTPTIQSKLNVAAVSSKSIPIPHKTLSKPSSSNTTLNTPPPPPMDQDQPSTADASFPPLPPGLRRECVPRHVAVIMDGNARWARRKRLPTHAGHEAGVRALGELLQRCCDWGIRVLTVFAFSTDNWSRPKVEVEFLMGLFERQMKAELENFMSEGIRVSVIGDSSKLPISLQKLITDAAEATKHNSRFHFIVAVSYSGQHDIVQACQAISQRVKDGLIQPEDIDESLVEQELQTKCTEFPCPDLLIRTSGELRISNFLLWQMAYTELFFVNSLWPDFGESDFVEALKSYQERHRRYGGRGSLANEHEIDRNR
ncbi:hypothetical protein Scep_014970 [Stephania cephalantha]|uniref:Alkyl transferase n=1 Tax=Stephania cephalantha TaxID=152367 RepID=A0AAP0J298_9MAGN